MTVWAVVIVLRTFASWTRLSWWGKGLLSVLIVGAVLGAALIVAVIIVYLRKQTLDRGGALMIFGGIILLGFSAWQSFEFTAGQMSLRAKSAINGVEKAIAINESRVKYAPYSHSSCEEERERLKIALQNEIYTGRKLNEQLSNVYKELHDVAMTPIRNMR